MRESTGPTPTPGSPVDPPSTVTVPPRGDGGRFTVVVGLTLAVIGGSVSYALLTRGGEPRVATSLPPAPTAAPTSAPPRVERGAPMPEGCGVDPAHPPVLELVGISGNRVPLGMCRQGVPLERKVTVRNTGGGVLCVRRVEVGCGCIDARWEGDAHVQPSASGTLTIRIDTSQREGSEEKWVTLYTNDPAHQPGLVLYAAFEVRLGIMLGLAPASQASRVDFGMRGVGRPATAALRLKSPTGEPDWTILGVESVALPESRRSTFAWKLVPVEKDDPDFRWYDLELTHPGLATIGRDEQPIRIRTSHPGRPVIEADATLTVVPKYYASPSEARFGYLSASDVGSWKTFTVKPAEAGRAFTVKGAKLEGQGFVAGDRRRVDDGWTVDVRYDGAARKEGLVEATLVVSIDDPEAPEVRIPLAGRATGR